MAELPTIKEMAEEVAKEALEIINTEKPELKEIKEAYEDGFNAGKAEAYDECIETIKKCYVCEIIMKLEELKEKHNGV